MKQTSFDFDTMHPVVMDREDGPSCPMCGAPGVPNGPPIPASSWNEEARRYETNEFTRWWCGKCGFKWLI
jgi:ribosomal protein S27AE